MLSMLPKETYTLEEFQKTLGELAEKDPRAYCRMYGHQETLSQLGKSHCRLGLSRCQGTAEISSGHPNLFAEGIPEAHL